MGEAVDRKRIGGTVARGVPNGFDGAELARIREDELKLSRRAAARKAKVAPYTLLKWETGAARPQIDVLCRVLSALGIAPEAVIRIPRNERTLGDWRALRLMLQPELAAASGLSISQVANLETGLVAAPKPESIAKLAVGLDISEAEVLAAWRRTRGQA